MISITCVQYSTIHTYIRWPSCVFSHFAFRKSFGFFSRPFYLIGSSCVLLRLARTNLEPFLVLGLSWTTVLVSTV